MHILGLANGSTGGNSEILLKAALMAASKADPSITTSWVHVPSVTVPTNPKPLESSSGLAGANIPSMRAGEGIKGLLDDRPAVLNAILEADGLIFATAVYSHQPAGTLKALLDLVLGPFTDAALARRVLEGKKAGNAMFANMSVDERILKPRVAAFIATAGSSTPDQVTMVLPTLHQFVYSLHAKVVDQHVFLGMGNAGSVLLADQPVKRAQTLGERVASQIGKSFDEAAYLGPEPKGSCPHCHMSKIDLFETSDNSIGCLVCGNTGKLMTDERGRIVPKWDDNSDYCCITMRGKAKHMDDIFAIGAREANAMKDNEEIWKRLKHWRELTLPTVRLPSKGWKL